VSLYATVLAAGEGKRLKSSIAKVLHAAAGRPLIEHVLAAIAPLQLNSAVVVVGHQREQLVAALEGRPGLQLAVQDPPRGTGDAVACALPFLPTEGEVLVVSGDTPLILPSSLRALLELRRERGAAIAVTTAVLADGGAYGRVVRDRDDNVVAIVEARDPSEAQRRVKEVNAGSYACDLAVLRLLIAELSPENAQGEYYLTDVVALAVARGLKVAGLQLEDASEMAGVNTRSELALVHRLLNQRTIARLQGAGVTVLDPASTFVESGCLVGRDTVLEPGVHLRGSCRIGDGCRIGAHSVLESVSLAPGTVVPPLTHRTPPTRQLTT
jgi:bifunctional UDP-N-acetylglucosamine pyrophosphorylase / glucosamine-1-phosphate N-acetyltransferase